MKTNTYEFFEMIRKELDNEKIRSCWKYGIRHYAYELVDSLEEAISSGYNDISDLHSEKMVEKILLNGADTWYQFSWGGCSLIYDRDIARRLCTETELKKTDNGRKQPNRREQWLDVQARALYQACIMVQKAVEKALDKAEEQEEEVPAAFIDVIRRDGTASSAG